jgi:serine/threonine protein kinase
MFGWQRQSGVFMNNKANSLKASEVIGQRYVILRQLREEPWGGVYLAQDRLLKVEVGLKFISHEAPEFDLAKKIFIQEASLCYKLRHPLILAVFHGSEVEEGFTLVQEPYAGESLITRLIRLQRFTLPQALNLLEVVGRAVAFAHEQGAVHQGLDPLNVLIEGEKGKVANFACPPKDEAQVSHLELKAYVAPEVVRGEEVTPAANVFSLGVLGFRLTAGSLPYPLTFDEAFPYRLETPPIDLEEIPPPLQNFLLRCLAPEPEDRFENVVSLLTALEQSRELWRAAPRQKPFPWPGKPGVSMGDSAKSAVKRIWEEGKTRAGKLTENMKPIAEKIVEKVKSAPPRFLWGSGLALVAVILIWAGAKAVLREVSLVRPGTGTAALKAPSAARPAKIAKKAQPSKRRASRSGRTTGADSAPRLATISPTGAPSARKDSYMVLVASYTRLKPALALRNRLKSQQITAKAFKTTPGRKTVYQVRVGPLTGKQRADEVARLIKKHEGLTVKIVKISSSSKSRTSIRPRP